MNTRPNIVLIHGAWAEGSCWSGVIERLQADGYHVTAPQFPLTTLADDVARLRQVLALQDRQTIVAGHGGEISFQSQEGQGTTISVRLPLAQPAAPDAPADDEAAHDAPTLHGAPATWSGPMI